MKNNFQRTDLLFKRSNEQIKKIKSLCATPYFQLLRKIKKKTFSNLDPKILKKLKQTGSKCFELFSAESISICIVFFFFCNYKLKYGATLKRSDTPLLLRLFITRVQTGKRPLEQ